MKSEGLLEVWSSENQSGNRHMLLGFARLDYGLLVGYLMMMIVLGAYFSRQQHTNRDLFLAGQSIGWFPLGRSPSVWQEHSPSVFC